MSSIPKTAVLGETGFLAEENAQRLLSIFMEAGMTCLAQLRAVVESELRSRRQDEGLFDRYYKSGLVSISQWPISMVRSEIADIEAHYPEMQKLHQFVFISVISEAAYTSTMEHFSVPPVVDVYHSFLRRLVGETDVQRGVSFLEQPLIYRKVVFVQAFRNAYHDLAQKHYVAPPSFKDTAFSLRSRKPGAAFAQGSPPAQEDDAQSQVETLGAADDALSKGSGKSRLHTAMSVVSQGKELAEAREGEKSVLLLNSPATLMEQEEPPGPGEAPPRAPSALQEGIRQLQDKAGQASEAP